jgi:hypothetical protein
MGCLTPVKKAGFRVILNDDDLPSRRRKFVPSPGLAPATETKKAPKRLI